MGFLNLFKKKDKLFGSTVEKSCDYCRYNYADDDYAVICKYDNGKGAEKCKKYEYDPTKRKPKKEPKLKEYKPEDFEL